jgi:lysophospholipase L1-like esterase
MSSSAPLIPLRRKVAYAAVVTLVLLGLCEGAVRVRAWLRYGQASPALRDPMLVFDPDAGLYVPQPGYEIRGAKIHVKINSLGFRGDEFTADKPPRTIRIVCLGASTTFSTEVSSNAATWPHRLQEKLQDAHPHVRFEVVNAAVPGYVAGDNLKNLHHRVLRLDPDLVIYYEANNEIVRDTRELALAQGVIDDTRPSALVAALSRASLLFDLAVKNLTILAAPRVGSTPRMDDVPPELPTRFIGVLDDMRAELARRAIPMMVSTFVVKYRRGQERQTQIANADVAFYYMPWMSIDGLLDAMDTYNDAILKFAATRRLDVVDDREAIPADGEHFADCMHLTDKGSELMAERFFRYLNGSRLLNDLIQSKRLTASS